MQGQADLFFMKLRKFKDEIFYFFLQNSIIFAGFVHILVVYIIYN
jgi:hypothetical protein